MTIASLILLGRLPNVARQSTWPDLPGASFDGLKSAHHLKRPMMAFGVRYTFLAAQKMCSRTETEYFSAKRKAACQLGVELYRHRPGDLPSNKDIRDQFQAMNRIHEGPKRPETLRDLAEQNRK